MEAVQTDFSPKADSASVGSVPVAAVTVVLPFVLLFSWQKYVCVSYSCFLPLLTFFICPASICFSDISISLYGDTVHLNYIPKIKKRTMTYVNVRLLHPFFQLSATTYSKTNIINRTD